TRTHGLGERRDELRIQAQVARIDGLAQLAGDVDIGEAPHEAGVVALIDLDAVAPAILGRLARGLRGCKRVHELAAARIDGGYADADGDMHPSIGAGAGKRGELLDTFAQAFGKLLRPVERHWHQRGETIT